MAAKASSLVRARDVMNTAVHFIDGMATAAEAAQKMKSEHTTTLIVEKRHDDDAWAVVVTRDIIKGVLIDDRRAEKVHIYEIMSKPVVTVGPDMDIRYVARLMERIGIRRILVEEGGKLVGIVSQSDLVLRGDLFG